MASKIVTAVGVSINTQHGDVINARLTRAVEEAILACNAEGISTDEKNAPIIKQRMTEAREAELARILSQT